jgi:FkbM family methyltransferase
VKVPDAKGIWHDVPPALVFEKNGVEFTVDLTCEATGQQLQPHWYTNWWLSNWADFEPETFALFDREVGPDDVVLDIGAWIGPTCLYLARKAKRVVALEPDPAAFAVLKANLVLNPWATNLAITNIALSDRTGPTPFGGNGDLGNSQSTLLIRDPDWTAHSAPEMHGWHHGMRVGVQGMTIDDLGGQVDLSGCTFVKMDIEGGEWVVLPAMAEWLGRHRPSLHLSLHWKTLSAEEAIATLDTLYAIYPAVEDAVSGWPVTKCEAVLARTGTLFARGYWT